MYHYKECGLPYVYLTNGFTIDKVEDEEFVSIDNLYELHALIGRQYSISSKTDFSSRI